MAIYTGRNMPKEVGRTTMDSEVKSWLEDGPVLGSHEPIHVQRAAHDRFIDTNKPPIGKVEHLGLDGPHGTTRSAAWSRHWRLRDFSAKRSKRRAPPRPSAESALRSPRLVEGSLGNCRKQTAAEVRQAGMTSLSHAAMGKRVATFDQSVTKGESK